MNNSAGILYQPIRYHFQKSGRKRRRDGVLDTQFTLTFAVAKPTPSKGFEPMLFKALFFLATIVPFGQFYTICHVLIIHPIACR
ncbi:MAG TPA: hypothetical protein PKC72_07120 [Chitinophagaceae bacterium]|nr:hypothetical protein [Chitinophagaceae bacterium]